MFLNLSAMLHSGRQTDHAIACRGAEVLTFNQFKQDTARLKAWLKGAPDQPYALAVQDSYLFAVGFLALLHAGRTVLLPPNAQPETLAEFESQGMGVLQDSGILCAIRDGAVEGCSEQFGILNPDACKISFFTSGSTGKPKEIAKNLQQLETEVACLEELWGEQIRGAKVLATVSHQHIYGLLFKLLWPMSSGRAFVVDVPAYWEHVRARLSKSSCLVSSPAHLSRYPEAFRLTEEETPAMVFSSGGPLPLEAAQNSRVRLGKAPVEIYGSTETGGIGYRQQELPGTAWTPFAPLALGSADGALRVRSPYIAAADWYQTNDMVQLNADGTFVLQGRNDKIVKIEGKRVSLMEVEQYLRDHEWVKEASVLILERPQPLLACVVELHQGAAKKCTKMGAYRFSQKLRTDLRQKFEPMALPKRWRFVSQIPENSEGKRLHRVLAALFE